LVEQCGNRGKYRLGVGLIRLDEPRIRQLVAPLLAGTAEISRRMGYLSR
jgi:DNA-binding IclR family transcriptional regulator